MTKQLAGLAAIIVLIAIVGSSIWSFLRVVDDPNTTTIIETGPNLDYVIGVTAFSIGVVAFFGIAGLNYSGKEQQTIKGERLRTSIACALLLTYLYIVSFTTFVANSANIGQVTERFVESFSSVMGITIAFYFGASAATQIFGKDTNGQSDHKDTEPSG